MNDNNQHARTEKVLGSDGVAALSSARIILFGVGGVGSYAAEALVRAGVGALTIVDKDVVDVTNINRQLIATHQTIGKDKVTVAAERYRSINPNAVITPINACVLPENIEVFDLETYDYVLDAVDMVTAKLAIIETADHAGVPIISCMGTGNKLDPTQFRVTTIEKTAVCPLAKVMRRELKQRGIKKVKVVYSEEVPTIKCTPPGSVSFVPGAAGLAMAGAVIRALSGQE